jgi:hypothetical protein
LAFKLQCCAILCMFGLQLLHKAGGSFLLTCSWFCTDSMVL